MNRKAICGCIVLSASLVLAAAGTPEAPWTAKQISQWSEQDAWQVLSSSPWVKKTPTNYLHGMTEDQRRDSGDMNAQGGKDGVGFGDAIKPFGGKNITNGTSAPGLAPVASQRKMDVRWESALPIRAAEVRVNEAGAPVLEGEEYAIAIYNVDLKVARIEFKSMVEELKKFATLKIEGKKDIRPTRVAVLEMGGNMATIIYLFPRTAHISLDDARVTFSAQIGRLVLAQYFYPPEMVYQGKLAL